MNNTLSGPVSTLNLKRNINCTISPKVVEMFKNVNADYRQKPDHFNQTKDVLIVMINNQKVLVQ